MARNAAAESMTLHNRKQDEMQSHSAQHIGLSHLSLQSFIERFADTICLQKSRKIVSAAFKNI